MFEDRIAQIEGAEAAFATGSGMAAVWVALAALLGNGDRVVSSRSLFGSCFVILDEILPRWGVETVFVDGPDLDQWRAALSEPTAAVFFETPSNPMQELVDIQAVCDLAHAAGRRWSSTTSSGRRCSPVRSSTEPTSSSTPRRSIDGQGRVLGGAVLGPREFIDGPVQNLMPWTCDVAFNAWVLVKGLETMSLRVMRMAASCLEWLGSWKGMLG